MTKSLFIAVLLLMVLGVVADAQPVHVTIGFEDLPVGTAVSDQYPNTVFSCDPGWEPRVTDEVGSTGCSRPNVVTPGVVGGSIDPWRPLYVDFRFPVNDLELCVADVFTNGGGIIRIFENGTFAEEVPYACITFSCPIDLSRFNDVTRIELIPWVLHAKWDSFSFTYVDTSPVPTLNTAGVGVFAVLLAAAGAVFLWWRRS